MDTFWEDSLVHRLKVERNLNFSTITNEDDEFGFSRKKTARDPMSHRIIEKRRRDRMNNCLADLSRLVPTNYLKKGRGRIEKTEIIEMAIKHLKHLQAHPCKNPATCEVAKTTEQNHKHQYRLGFQECMSETVRFLVEIEGFYASDGLCVRLVSHLQKHYDKVTGGMCYTQALGMMHSEDSKGVPMDTEHEQASAGFQVENFSEDVVQHSDEAIQSPPNETSCSAEDAVKQEISVAQAVKSSFQEPTEVSHDNSAASKALCHLSTLLQNSMTTKDSPQDTVNKSGCSENSEPSCGSSNYIECTMGSPLSERARKIEEVYKFKNNIKHRFNADLQQHAVSPTDGYSDHGWPEERMRSDIQCGTQNGSANNNLSSHLLASERCPDDNRNNQSFTPPTRTVEPRAEMTSPSALAPPAELSIKIIDKSVTDSRNAHSNNWDCHGDTGSSCGSNLSPHAARKPNGSSSGYSTNGELPSGPKVKIQTPDRHSPIMSPYSHNADHLSSQSPSPQPVHHATMRIPIFALHPRGTFYIPLTIDSSLVTPYIMEIEEISPILHPVSICVNFSLGRCIKPEKVNDSAVHFYSPPLFMDKFRDRYTEGEGHSAYYPSSPGQN